MPLQRTNVRKLPRTVAIELARRDAAKLSWNAATYSLVAGQGGRRARRQKRMYRNAALPAARRVVGDTEPQRTSLRAEASAGGNLGGVAGEAGAGPGRREIP